MTVHRIGLVVPSSNITVETEVPALLARHASARFSFHSSRMRMHTVSPEQLRAMNAQRERCVGELADAGVDALLYACLVAVMAQGPGEHRRTEDAVTAQLTTAGQRPAVLSSAGALVQALAALGARRIALVTPYLRPLAQQVVNYLESEGFDQGARTGQDRGPLTGRGELRGDGVLGTPVRAGALRHDRHQAGVEQRVDAGVGELADAAFPLGVH